MSSAARSLAARGRRQVGRLARRAGVRAGLEPGLLSVVVPAHGVEKYLAECLESLRAQSWDRVEIIVVDDGSPDRSAEIAREHARQDPRVRVISVANEGPSGARNRGVATARGEFLTFVDGDDRVDPDAFRLSVESLQGSGSDFAVSFYRRLRRGSPAAPGWWIRRLHEEARTGVDLATCPEAMVNAVVWSKVFRRTFYDGAGLTFPVGMLYEDQPVSMRAYAQARAFDVLPHVGVEWRVRDDKTSITQQNADSDNLRHHVDAVEAAFAELEAAGDQEVVVRRALQLLEHNMPYFVHHNLQRDPGFFVELRRALQLLVDRVPRDRFVTGVAASRKVLYELVLAGEMERAARLQEELHRGPARHPTRLDDGVVHVDLGEAVSDLDLAEELLRLSDVETSLRTRGTRLAWTGGHGLRIEGWAFPERTELSGTSLSIAVEAVSADGRRVPFDVQVRPEPAADRASGSWFADATPGGFVADLDTLALPDSDQPWRLEVTLEVDGLVRSGHLTTRPWAEATLRRPLVEDSGRVVLLERNRAGITYLRTRRSPVRAEAVSLRDGSLEVLLTGDEVVSGHLADGAATNVLVPGVLRPGIDPADGGSGATASTLVLDLTALPAPPAGARPRVARVVVVTPTGRSVAVVDLPDSQAGSEPDLATVSVGRTTGGALAVVQRAVAFRVDEAVVQGEPGAEELLVEASLLGVDPGNCRPQLRAPGVVVDGTLEPGSGGRHRVRFPLTRSVWGRDGLVVPRGTYQLHLQVGSDLDLVGVPSRALVPVLPVATLHPRLRATVEVYSPARPAVRLVLAAPLREDERSPRQQRLLREGAKVAVADRRSIFFRTLYGENTNGNCLGIHEELRRRDSELVLGWSTADHSVAVPEGGTRLLERSREWHEAMASSRYHVVDVHQMDWFERPEGQDLIETMHGYPYKVMGHEWWAKANFPPQQVRNYDRRAREWTYFVSPASYATPLLEAAFLTPAGSTSTVLEIGYPRNDALVRPEREVTRDRTRELLGLRPDQVAVLYAPTYRDYLSFDDRTAVRNDFFDPHQAAALLPDNYVVMVRGHAFHARVRGERERQSDRVLDVTDHPDVNDLVLASDVAILDYSSLRFDYVLVDKPMIFLVPDREVYDEFRGGVIPFAPTAPGPFVDTTAEAVEHLRDLERLSESHREARQTFRENYVELEDGRAAARLVDAVMVPRGDARPHSVP